MSTTQPVPDNLWPAALSELQLQMPRVTFETWLKSTTAQVDGDTLTVLAGNAFAQDWLDNRLRNTIERTVAGLAGRPLDIIFSVRTNGHSEADDARLDLSPDYGEAEEGFEVKHYEIWAPADPTVLRIMPDLAEEIGLNESIVLLQIDYWIRHSNNVRDGRRWTYQSLRDMKNKAFRWWGKDTISRAIKSLEDQELIFVNDYNQHKYDRTQWFALNPKGFKRLKSVELKQVVDEGGVSN